MSATTDERFLHWGYSPDPSQAAGMTTDRGLAIGDPVERVTALYPGTELGFNELVNSEVFGDRRRPRGIARRRRRVLDARRGLPVR
ncbi:MAG: hypothetical protein ACK5OX_02150 [Desertimonas sp.]